MSMQLQCECVCEGLRSIHFFLWSFFLSPRSILCRSAFHHRPNALAQCTTSVDSSCDVRAAPRVVTHVEGSCIVQHQFNILIYRVECRVLIIV